MILGIFLKDREVSFFDGCLEVKIDRMEAFYAKVVLGGETPGVSFEDYMTAASVIVKRDENNMVILDFEDFAPPGEIRELRFTADDITSSVTLEDKETKEISQGFRDYRPPEDFLSYLKRNMKKSDNPLVTGDVEQVASC